MLEPEPVNVAPSGCLVRVHEPEGGRPERNTLPVDILHEGWVMVPITGAPGMSGPWMITTGAEAPDGQPDSFVTVKVNVPAGMPVIIAVLPEPSVTTFPGVRVTLHGPGGRPVSWTVPVGELQEGWVIVPGTGGEGITGGSFITAF